MEEKDTDTANIIGKMLAPPIYQDEEQARIAALLNIILLTALVLSAVFVIVAPIISPNPVFSWVATGALVLPQLAALWLMRHGRLRLACVLFSSVLWLVVTISAVFAGGVRSASFGTYTLIVLLAGLLLGWRVGVLFIGMSVLSGLLMLHAERLGILPEPLISNTLASLFTVQAASFCVAAALLYLAVRSINDGLERARRNERALEESNRVLEAEIAERNRVEKALRQSEERYRTILESIEDGYFEVDLAGNLTFFNDPLCEIVGYPRSELMGMNNRQYMDQENARAVLRTFNQVYRTGNPTKGFDWQLIGKDGTRRYVEASVSLIRDVDGQPAGFRGIARDVTERRQAEYALRRSEEWLRAIVEGTHALLVHVDTRGLITYVNDAASRATGYRPEEMIGKLYLRFIHPEDRAQVGWAYLDQIRMGEPSTVLEFRIIGASGASRWVSFVANPMFDKGCIVGLMGVAIDITDRVRAEEALRQRSHELQARNEELDAFAHTVAHDLQDPLSLIVGFADVLKDEYASLPDEELRRHLHTIAQSGAKMSNIIDELLLLVEVRKMDVISDSLDMAHIVEEAKRRLAYQIEDKRATIISSGAFPSALGYGPWVEEVWVNYLSNALKYGGQPPQIELGAAEKSDGMVRFWVRDNGPGLRLDEQARLFTPFTKLSQAQTKGHGLGLSIVRRIVIKLGGEVGVESAGVAGQGCVFSFTLPGIEQSSSS